MKRSFKGQVLAGSHFIITNKIYNPNLIVDPALVLDFLLNRL